MIGFIFFNFLLLVFYINVYPVVIYEVCHLICLNDNLTICYLMIVEFHVVFVK